MLCIMNPLIKVFKEGPGLAIASKSTTKQVTVFYWLIGTATVNFSIEIGAATNYN